MQTGSSAHWDSLQSLPAPSLRPSGLEWRRLITSLPHLTSSSLIRPMTAGADAANRTSVSFDSMWSRCTLCCFIFLLCLCSYASMFCYSISPLQLTHWCEIPIPLWAFWHCMGFELSALLRKSLMHFFPHLVAMSTAFFSLHWFLSYLLSNYSQTRLQAANQWRDLCRLNAQDPLMNHFPLHVNLRLLIHTDDKCGPIQVHGYRTKS